MGENSLLVSCAELLLERGHRVLGVVSPVARIRSWAERAGLSATDFGAELVPYLSNEPFDYLFSIANLRMLSAKVLALPRALPVNFHDGPLPRHAGMYATTWAVLGRERSHSVSWHVMTERADAGDLLVQRSVAVDPIDTSASLNLKCLQAGIDSFGELVSALERGVAVRRAQDPVARIYHGRFDRPPGAGFLRWDRSAEELAAAVRATDFGPHPNTFGTVKAVANDEPMLVRAATVLTCRTEQASGTVLAVGAAGEVTVATTGRDLQLADLRTVGGDPLDAAALAARGVRSGSTMVMPDPALLAAAEQAERRCLPGEASWVRRLAHLQPADPGFTVKRGGGPVHIPIPTQLASEGPKRTKWLLTALLAFLVRIGITPGADLGLRLPARDTGHPVVDALYADWVPLRVPELGTRSFAELYAEVSRLLHEEESRGLLPHDLWTRHPLLRAAPRSLPAVVELAASEVDLAAPMPGSTLLIQIPREPGPCQWVSSDDRLAEYAAAFLQALARDPQSKPAQVPLGTTRARRAVTIWNNTATDFPLDQPVHRLISRQALMQPDAPAVVCGGETTSYGELELRSSNLAGLLRARGAGPGRLVGVYLERTADLVVALLGVLKSGAAYVPLAGLYPSGRIAEMIADADPVLLITEPGLAGSLPAFGTELLVLRQESSVVATSYDGADVPPSADAYVIYTSGSTGRPKGVRIGHRALTNLVCAMSRSLSFTPGDRLLAITTVCFDIAALELFVPLVTGGQVELASSDTAVDGFELRAHVERSRPTVMQATPATWRMLIEAGWPGPPKDAPLRMLCGGEAMPPDLAQELLTRGSQVWNMYGPTETTIWVAVSRVRPGSPPLIGPPIANTRFHVLDDELRPLPPGVAGELFIGGEQVAAGYLNQPQLTAERFVRVPGLAGVLYRSGDLVRQTDEGHLEFLGRLDGQVKVRGHRIEPGEIEAVLCAHPLVREAVVALRGCRLVAYIVPHELPALPEQLREHLATVLPDYMVPARFVTMERIPLTANGKTDRMALPDLPLQAGAAGALNGTERAIAQVWREVLGLKRVAAEDNFFELGGDSVLLIRVMARLRDRVRLPLTRVEMFEYPTIRALARRLDAPAPTQAVRRRTVRSEQSVLNELRRRRTV
ncbi:amino acid adenylation domain-containing protein [Streptomyces sp. XH2]|uniref:amino acid adenylation domain-containing protein n=1 Tax=Streptomyces sp. XH2 TaxID=3412483 RepID=UPI003C79FEFA